MRKCPICGFRDNPLWRSSRFELNADLMDWCDFQKEYPKSARLLENKKNHDPIESPEDPDCFLYRRGTGGCKVYRVPKEDFKVPRERVSHKQKVPQ
ncbi:hypothetical protein MUP59_07960 [Candidatus Bathyarchaeota archaeon]|nr:hypothetical protein [Candidatus Bathyarchaeota archaeon]